jgi:hypothetical protein
MIKRGRFGTKRGPILHGVDLQDHREELFCRMVCDGLSLGVAFARAGFISRANNAPSNLWNLPRLQERASAILEARRTTGVVSLGEVTDMLKRVFAGAHSAEEYSAAHNAAFSLARLYGHVTDKATLEVIRKPSRDPDAPSEQALASWVQDLPALPAPSPLAFGPGPDVGPGPLTIDVLPNSPPNSPANSAFSRAPANPIGPATVPEPQSLNEINGLDQSAGPGPSTHDPRPEYVPGLVDENFLNDFNWLAGPGPTPGRPGNGAPTRPVTGTPIERAHSELLSHSDTKATRGPGPTPTKTKRVPLKRRQVPGRKREFPTMEDLF